MKTTTKQELAEALLELKHIEAQLDINDGTEETWLEKVEPFRQLREQILADWMPILRMMAECRLFDLMVEDDLADGYPMLWNELDVRVEYFNKAAQFIWSFGDIQIMSPKTEEERQAWVDRLMEQWRLDPELFAEDQKRREEARARRKKKAKKKVAKKKTQPTAELH